VNGALPAEFSLMAACCRWPPSPAREAAVTAAASAPIDWEGFERVVARHRVVALAQDGLLRSGIAAPASVAGRLAGAAAAARRRALAMARETLRISEAFDAAGVPFLAVKGASLAILAYGDVGIKQAGDIDILTAPESALAGRRVLERLGYSLTSPDWLNEDQFVRFMRLARECAFTNQALDMTVDLHWRLTENARLLQNVGVHSAAQEVEIGGARLQTLANDPLFAFLSVHGTVDCWFRFKWLADVGALLNGLGETEIERLYRAAAGMGAGRGPAVTLLLCNRLLGLALPASLIAEIRADAMARALERSALRCMTWGGGEREIPYLSSATFRIALSQFFIAPGGGYVWNEIRFKWNSPTDRARLKLPRSLGFLYHLLRVPLWLGRFGKRLFDRLA